MADGKKTVSEKIFELLKQKDMSQKEFSERTGISQSTISDWKRKKTNPAVDKILKICEVLRVSPSELLEEDEIESAVIELLSWFYSNYPRISAPKKKSETPENLNSVENI